MSDFYEVVMGHKSVRTYDGKGQRFFEKCRINDISLYI